MRHLLVLRHAKSSWKHDGLSDHDRPLNKRGLHDAPGVGRLLRDRGLLPDCILSSTAVRACTTAHQVAEAANLSQAPVLVQALYLAPAESYLEHLAAVDETLGRVMVVGHNPGLEELVKLLTGRDEIIATASLAHIGLPIEYWAELDSRTRGTLLDLWHPRDHVD